MPAAVVAAVVAVFATTLEVSFATVFADSFATFLPLSFATFLAVPFTPFLAIFFPASTFLILSFCLLMTCCLNNSAPLDAVPVTGLEASYIIIADCCISCPPSIWSVITLPPTIPALRREVFLTLTDWFACCTFFLYLENIPSFCT